MAISSPSSGATCPGCRWTRSTASTLSTGPGRWPSCSTTARSCSSTTSCSAAFAAGCPVCSSAADTFNGAVPHLNARGVTFTAISRAPLDKLLGYRQRMGWTFPWASSYGTDYNFDLEISRPEEVTRAALAGDVPPVVTRLADHCGTEPAAYLSEMPVMSSYALDGATVYLTYSTTARGLEFMMGYYGFLDRSPLGRNEGDPPEMWLHRHDEYP